MSISAEDRNELLRLARAAMGYAVGEGPSPQVLMYEGVLGERRGCFVTLTNAGQLRGCIGTFTPRGALAEMVVEMAIQACRDPRFTGNPITARTMSEHIDLDVSGLLRREMTLNEAGDRLMEIVARTVNGRLTCAEALGHREFVLTRLYPSA